MYAGRYSLETIFLYQSYRLPHKAANSALHLPYPLINSVSRNGALSLGWNASMCGRGNINQKLNAANVCSTS